MISKSLSESLRIESKSQQFKIDQLQSDLEEIPDSFFALFWLYAHDFLFISPSIESVTGHNIQNFASHGMVYFTGIIPPPQIDSIYQSLNSQVNTIKSSPEGLFEESFLHVKAAVLDPDKQEIPVNYNAILMDEKVFDPISYLVLCAWIDTRNKTDHEVLIFEKEINRKLLKIKEIYFQSNPERYEFLKIKNKISQREKEVAQLLAHGHSTKNISEILHISFNTVESHRKNLLQKLDAKNTAELIYKFNRY